MLADNNKSIIEDLMEGFVKSTITCNRCSY